MASYASTKITYLLAIKIIDFDTDTSKICLMQTGFTFDRATHHVYADISASELATANGYVAGGVSLGVSTVTENDTLFKTTVTWPNASWTAAGGSIGPAAGAIIYDDTVAAPVAKPIIGYIDFGSDQTQVNGGIFTIANPEVDLST